jgi:4,5-DOPA dioxygenase extradiol
LTSATNRWSGRVIFVSHGGGPLPLLGDARHRELINSLESIAGELPTPSGIVVISAHWEEAQPTVTGGVSPALIYDYYGFPEESYNIRYSAPGAPPLAESIFSALSDAGIPARTDTNRGFDHGLFVPLKIMFPDAGIPCVQLSLIDTLSAAAHVQTGKALAGRLGEDVLVVGSGFSFHNLKAFFSPPRQLIAAGNEAFERWLTETCTGTDLDENDRERRLINWDMAPGARLCHPREEHLLPLHVCYGIAQAPAREAFKFQVMGVKASAFVW